jgi:hypothetical protein
MKRVIIAVFVGVMLSAAALAGEVSQGKCIKYDTQAKVIAIEEYDTNFSKEARYGKSTGIVSEFDVSHAKIGIKPGAGDILRIAYDTDGTAKRAIKVMNVSKQDLRKK